VALPTRPAPEGDRLRLCCGIHGQGGGQRCA